MKPPSFGIIACWCCPVAFLCLPLLARGDELATALDPNLGYQARRSNPVTYDVEFVVTVTAPCHTKHLKVWLPLPQSDAAQEITEGEIRVFPAKLEPAIGREEAFGNKFAYFDFERPEGAQVIRHTFKVKVWQLDWDLDPATVVRVKRWPSGFERYLKSDRAVVIDDQLQQVVTKEIVPNRMNAAEDLAAAMDWLNANMKYDHAKGSLKASSEHALLGKTGHCSDYHGLCAAF